MPKADCVHSTPPTDTTNASTARRPSDGLARRTFLSGLAMAVPLVAIAPAALAAEPDPIYALIEAHREAVAAHAAACDEQTRLERLCDRDADWIAEEPCHVEWRAFETLIDTPPTTFPGLVAWATYLDGVRREDPWKFDDDPAKGLVGTLARALGNLEMQSMGSAA